jgi:hypothetical protein
MDGMQVILAAMQACMVAMMSCMEAVQCCKGGGRGAQGSFPQGDALPGSGSIRCVVIRSNGRCTRSAADRIPRKVRARACYVNPDERTIGDKPRFFASLKD